MYESHPTIETPQNTQVIWRFLDLWKFLDIIDNKKLYMSRMDQFEDKYEGRIPVHLIKELDDSHPLKRVDDYNGLRRSSYVSSWAIIETETYPLWKIYTDYRAAVAIKSNVGKLIESLKATSNSQFIGEIKYVNPNSKQYHFNGNMFQILFEKRDYFKFENELRIITSLPYENTGALLALPTGTKIDIDPDILIEDVYLAPNADENFKELVKMKMESLNLNKSIHFSGI